VRHGETELVAEVAAHAGSIGPDEARRVLATVLAEIGAHLAPADRERVGAELPASLAGWLERDPGRAIPVELRLRGPGTSVARARELVASACRALASALSVDTLARLGIALPASLADLLVAPAPPSHASVPRRRRDTLAEARPGSRHPVSEARPAPAQRGSVAATPAPHAEEKLSSTPGPTQVREHDTLAEGHPERPLSRTRE
jgi:uncharacterized protein (DUF2267 family)